MAGGFRKKNRSKTSKYGMVKRKKKQSSILSKARVYSMGVGVPKYKTVMLSYSAIHLPQQTTISIPDYVTYRLNGPFDPYAGIGGGQPLGFDQWSAFYQRYVVVGAKVTAKFTNHVGGNPPMRVGITFDKDTTLVDTTLVQRLERQKWKQTKVLYGLADNSATVVANYSGKKFWNEKDLIDNPALTATTGGVPTSQAYAHIWVECADGVGLPIEDQILEVRVDYIIKFFDQGELSRS